jgi:predicted DsbA family dithiol-disulfide isomerase
MCPECWKGKRMMLNEQMLKAQERLAKQFFFFSKRG